MSADRDEELGAALRALPVPEHREDFWSRVPARTPRQDARLPLVWLAAAAALVLAIAGVVVTRSQGGDPTGVVAGAPDVEMISGIVELEFDIGGGRMQTNRQSFAVAVDGSSSFEELDGSFSRTFDAVTRRLVMSQEEGSGQGTIGWFVHTNVEPQTPSSGFLRGLGAGGANGEQTPVTFLGRPAIRSEIRDEEPPFLRTIPNQAMADHIVSIVDRDTGLTLSYDARLDGVLVARIEVAELRVHERVDRSRFEVDPPDDARVLQDIQDRFQLVEMDAVDGVVGYAIDAPRDLEGFQRRSVAARRGTPGVQSGLSNPLHEDRVQLEYRRGWHSFTVAIWRARTDRPTNDDPVTGQPGGTQETLSTADGEARYSPAPTPHAWTTRDGFTITVIGHLTPDQFAQILDAIQPS